MKKLTICMMSLLLITVGTATAEISFPGKKAICSSYNAASCKVSQHRGKAGIIVGVVVVTLTKRLLKTSMGKKLKSFVKNACSDVWDFFRWVFVGND